MQSLRHSPPRHKGRRKPRVRIEKKSCLLKFIKDVSNSEKLFKKTRQIRHDLVPKEIRQLKNLKNKN